MVCSKYTIPSSSARSDETEDKGKEGAEIIKSLTPQWRQLGLLMDFDDGRTVDLIKAEYHAVRGPGC